MDARSHTVLPVVHFVGRFARPESVAFHSHPCDEIVLVTRGVCSVDVAGTRLCGHSGSLFVLPRDTPHDQRNQGLVHTTYIGFLAGIHKNVRAPRVVELEPAGAEARWIEDVFALQRQAPQHEHAAQPEQSAMQGLLLAILERVNQVEQRSVKVQEYHPAVAQVIERFEADLKVFYSLEDLSRLTHFSSSHLTTLFNRQFGCGPLRYQQNLRLSRALALLRDPYLSINEIAAQVGYNDANYFARLFGQRYKQSPTRWRSHPQRSS